MADKGLDFGFDPSFITRGVKSAVNAFGRLESGIKNQVGKINSGMTSMIKRIGGLAIAFKAVKGAFAQIPEVGQAFEIARETIMRNLLFPLRKEIFPLLQKLVDWVRDNRAQFIRFGQVLVNVFKTIAGAVKNVINIGRQLARGFLGFLDTIFGTTTNDILDLLNLLSFKFSVIVNFLGAILKPIIDGLGPLLKTVAEAAIDIGSGIVNIVNALIGANGEGNLLKLVFDNMLKNIKGIVEFVGKMTKAFSEGLAPKLEGLFKPIKKIQDAFSDILESIFGGTDGLGTWESIFESIGNVVGTVLVKAFEGVAKVVEFISKTIKEIKDFFTGDGLKGITDFFDSFKFDNKDKKTPKEKPQLQKIKGRFQHDEKKTPLKIRNIPQNVPAGNVNISVSLGGVQSFGNQESPTEIGQTIGGEITDVIAAQLNKERERRGG